MYNFEFVKPSSIAEAVKARSFRPASVKIGLHARRCRLVKGRRIHRALSVRGDQLPHARHLSRAGLAAPRGRPSRLRLPRR